MNRDFRDLIVELQSADARFLVVGAYALGAHGIPRATADFDIWIDASAENATRVMRALAEFGVALDALGIRASDLVDPDKVVHLGVPPYRIDIMSAIDGVEFADAWQRRIMERFQGIQAPFIGRQDLMANKRAVGRRKDLEDLENLQALAEPE